MKEYLLSIMVAVLLICIAAAIGRKILKHFFSSLSDQEFFVISVPLGTIVLTFFLFLFGILHLYYFFIFLLFLTFSFFFFIRDIIWCLKQFRDTFLEILSLRTISFLYFFCIFLLFSFILANFLFSLTPEIQWDSLVYHLTVPKIYAQHHAIIEIPYDFHTYMPKQFDILFVFGEILGLPQTSRIFAMLFNLFLPLIVFVFCKKYFTKTTALLTATILSTIPVFALYQSTTYNDTAVALFLFCAFFAFFLSFSEQRWLFFAGLFLGAAASTKIFLLGFLFYFSLAIFFRNYILCKNFFLTLKKSIHSILLIILLTLFVLSPWLTLSYLQTGNPIYPFFYSSLGGDHWNAQLDTFWNSLRQNYGVGRTFSGFFLATWFITMHPVFYGPVYGYTPIFLLFLPLFFFIRPHISSFQKTICFFSWYFGVFYFFLWFFLASDGRYLLPILPVATILVSIVLNELFQAKNLRLLCTLVFVIILISNLFFFAVIHRNTALVLVGLTDKETYIQSYVQNYAIAEWANQHLPLNSLLFIANDDRTYFYNIPYIQGYPIIQGVIDYPRIETSDALYTILKQKHVTHIIITHHILSDGSFSLLTFQDFYNVHITSLLETLVAEHGELLTEQHNVSLYLLR